MAVVARRSAPVRDPPCPTRKLLFLLSPASSYGPALPVIARAPPDSLSPLLRRPQNSHPLPRHSIKCGHPISTGILLTKLSRIAASLMETATVRVQLFAVTKTKKAPATHRGQGWR